MSKTTGKLLILGLALSVFILEPTFIAQAVAGEAGALALTTTRGQNASSQMTPRQQADDLVRRARNAMAEKDFDAADVLIRQAEALQVTYSPLDIMADKPSKARADLNRLRSAEQNSGGSLTGNFLGAVGIGQTPQPPTTSPFPNRTTGTQAAPLSMAGSVGGVRPLPPVGAGAQPPSTARQGNTMLRDARLALAGGDVIRAGQLLQQARVLPFNYGPLDDTPSKVEAAIREYSEVMASNNGPMANSEAHRRALAKSMLSQADALTRWNMFDQAERLINSIADLRVQFNPHELQPQTVLQRINLARASASGGSPAGRTQPSATDISSYAQLCRRAQQALQFGNLVEAERLASQAQRLGVPDSVLPAGTVTLASIRRDITTLRMQSQGVTPATASLAGGPGGAMRASYNPNQDTTHIQQASSNYTPGSNPYNPRGVQFAQATEPTPVPPSMSAPNYPNPMTPGGSMSPIPTPSPVASPGAENVPPLPSATPTTHGAVLFEQGLTALQQGNTVQAYDLFRQAFQYRDQLDASRQQRLQDYLTLLTRQTAPAGGAPADTTTQLEAQLAQQLSIEVAQAIASAIKMRDEGQPKNGITILQDTCKRVSESNLSASARNTLIGRLDRTVAELENHIRMFAPIIELEEDNDRIREEIAQRQRHQLEIEEELAILVDDFNREMDQQNYPQAELIAKQAAERAPNHPLVVQLNWQAKFVRRLMNNARIRGLQEEAFVDTLQSVREAATPFDDRFPFRYGDATEWREMSMRRAEWAAPAYRRSQTEAEIDIERKLKTPVGLEYTNAPLSDVLHNLASMADVNIFLDPQALAEYGVDSSTPVTISVRREIMLKSALNLILEPLNLGYIIKDEVLKITTEQGRDGDVYTVTYPVADLITAIPNFTPNQSMGLQGALSNAYGQIGFGGGNQVAGLGASPMTYVASNGGGGGQASINQNVLAQTMGGMGGLGAGGGSVPIGSGPGGAGGGVAPDFDSITDLITTTIQPETWDTVGGPGSIAGFPTNLSLVVSQTQDVHEEIADLLEQLRRLQDLQVTIEVRFITLNDNFFERIGVDFDFDINDNIDRPYQVFGRTIDDGDPVNGLEPSRNTLDQDFDRSVTVGLQAPGVFSADLDIPFTQNSYGLAVPQFGGFDATAGAQLGFAILSDIEAFFFINAAQGDRRSNILQAPKVTLFNGQQAFVSDTSQSPFVISVVPVVGDFAAAQQPVIVVLSEGTFMTVQAVVSQDRRYVRLTVVPFFSQITDVDTFRFDGTTTTTTDVESNIGEVVNPDDPDDDRRDNASNTDNTTTTTQGTTVQLPTFSFVTVTTTVSVPDGGTVLLGGIKRLSEGRNEFGTPILNKIPYINRLFKNVGIGRETQSLMMMVTPRIIIQEEEEENLGILPPP